VNVGLASVDSLIPNVALMKLSTWHKTQGDSVELAFPLAADTYDLVYRSKQFDYTPDDLTPWPCEVIDGGTGYSLEARLPCPDTIYPDYDLLDCDYAIGRITRGCPRRCPWCVVPQMDGKVRQVAVLDDFWRGQERVRLMDDNLTAIPEVFIETCERLAAEDVIVKFESLDIRIMTIEMARSLAKVKRWGRAHFAWDSMRDEQAVRRGIRALKDGGFPMTKHGDATFYVLIGYDTTPEEDLYRVQTLHALGVDSFAMPYDKDDPYQRRFTRWCNHKAIFKTVAWEDYLGGVTHDEDHRSRADHGHGTRIPRVRQMLVHPRR